jgi:hypothetical protein
MIRMNDDQDRDGDERDQAKAIVDSVCLDILGTIGSYAEANNFDIVGMRAIVFAGDGLTINFIVPNSIPEEFRGFIEEIAAQKALSAIVRPEINFIYAHSALA